jgi:hypothetical protein
LLTAPNVIARKERFTVVGVPSCVLNLRFVATHRHAAV